MESLNNSTFFDDRTISFLRKLFNSNGKVAPLSGNEQKFLDRSDELFAMNEHFDGRLVTNLSKYKNYAPVVDAVFFLLEAQKRDILDQADGILQMAVREEQVLTSAELGESLEEVESMTADWIVNLFGNGTGDRHAKKGPTGPSSSLNLDAMRNFK